MAITDKNFPAFISLMNRAKAAIPEIHGEVEEIHAKWRMNGCLDIQVTLIQDAPTESLREFHPGHYTVHFVWNPYQEGNCGSGGWDMRDYEDKEWQLPFDKTDAYLKPYQTPYTRGFGDIPEIPNREEWDGTPLFAGTDCRIQII
jgi:hypothetical protein